MKLSLIPVLALSVSAFALLVGCSGTDGAEIPDEDGDDVREDEAVSAKVTPGEFELDAAPNGKASACDRHTHLSLKAAFYSTAVLREEVTGLPNGVVCKLAVIPNERTYRLRLASTDCGSRHYTGSITRKGERRSIKLTDHRTRTCKDLVPAQIIVEETVSGSPPVTKFSRPAAAPESKDVTVTGELVRSFGIGGENTGSEHSVAEGTVELVLDEGEQNQFVAGKTARVKGTRTTLSGVETHNRPAIDVSEMLVCPAAGNINCMPGPNVRLSNLCAPDNRSWIVTNCKGVTFAF